jgi:Spy/CpxP family protein refolding chaperone
MANTKLSAFFSLLLVFASGIVVGIVGYRVYSAAAPSSVSKAPQKKMAPEEFRKQLMDEMAKEVHLDDQQISQLRQIYQDTDANFNQVRDDLNSKLHTQGAAIHEQQVEKIKAMLRPDQIPLYDALRARREAERKKQFGNGRHKGGPDQK